MSINYRGEIPSSKSIMNRALISSSYFGDFKILGGSNCDDVVHMRKGLEQLLNGEEVDCGSAGTVFRFITFRASRIVGRHIITGTERLLSRPQGEIISLLSQLGASAKMEGGKFVIESTGWRDPKKCLSVDRSKSSQFASGLILSAWDLGFPLELKGEGSHLSEGYWQMTLKTLRSLGMEISEVDGIFKIEAGQKVNASSYDVEIDLSSAFAVCAVAAVSGKAELTRFPKIPCLQPDYVFIDILKAMGVPVELRAGTLKVEKAVKLNSIEWNLKNCPDLFPVLAILCSLAEGTSRLYGAPHLIYKESNRIEKIGELLKIMGKEFEITDDGMLIHGKQGLTESEAQYDPDQDHRLAFSGALARAAGFKVETLDRKVVNKSFPEFWEVVGQ